MFPSTSHVCSSHHGDPECLLNEPIKTRERKQRLPVHLPEDCTFTRDEEQDEVGLHKVLGPSVKTWPWPWLLYYETSQVAS